MKRPAVRGVGLGAVVIAALLLAPRGSRGFELLRASGNPCDNASRNLHWTAGAAVVDLRFVAPRASVALAAEARDRWNQSVARFRFSPGEGTVCDFRDGIVTLAFSDTACNGRPLDSDALAVTVSRWGSEGQLLDAEVTFNAAASILNDPAVFREVAMHELGHVLGLDHSDACGTSGAGTLMRERLVVGAPRLDRPQADDIAGADFVYASAGQSGGDGSVPDGSNSCAVSAPARFPLAALSWLAVPALLLTRRVLFGLPKMDLSGDPELTNRGS